MKDARERHSPDADQPEPQPGLEQQLAELAASQQGVVRMAQLFELGFTARQIAGRVRRGVFHDVGVGIIAVGHTALSRRGRVNAAVLAAGDDAIAVSHVSAARAWGLVERAVDGPIHVSALDRRQLRLPPGTVLHRPRSLTTSEVVLHHDAPMTTPERTVRDLLPSSSTTEVTRMLEQLVTVVGRSPDALHEWGATLGRVPGKARLVEALDHIVGPAILRSELEREFRSLCQAAGLPLPQTNVRVARWELDALFPYMLAIELDSYRFHGGRWQFHRDRDKALDLAAMGYEVIRLTWFQVKRQPERVAKILAAVLARRAATVGASVGDPRTWVAQQR